MNGLTRRTCALVLLTLITTNRALPAPPPKPLNASTVHAVVDDVASAAAAAAAAAKNVTVPKPTLPPLGGPSKPTPPANVSKDQVKAGLAAARQPAELAALDAAAALAAALADDKLAALGAAAVAGDDVVAFADALPSAVGKGQPAAAAAAKLQSASDAVHALPLVAARSLVAKARAAADAAFDGGGARAAEAIDDARGTETASAELLRKRDAVAAALNAADAKLAPNSSLAMKLDAKHLRSIGVVVSLELSGRFDPRVPAQPVGRRLQQYTLPQPPPASLTPPRSAAVLGDDGWTPWLSFNDGPDIVFTPRLVAPSSVRNAFLSLVAARFVRASIPATRVAAVATPIDMARGLYDVRVSWRGGGEGSMGAALAAVNDVAPGQSCAGWSLDHDVCGALQADSPLDIVGVRARADTAPPGANAARLALGRRWRGLGVPSSIGTPQVNAVESTLGATKNITQGQLKDIYWFVDKSFEGFTNYIQGAASWRKAADDLRVFNLPDGGTAAQRALNTASNLKWAKGASALTQVLGGVRTLLGVVGGALFIAGLLSAFLPAQPDPQIMASLNTIQIVTNETLSRVKDIQRSLGDVSRSLNDLYVEFKDLECYTKSDTTKDHVATLKSYWTKYYGDPDFATVQPTAGSWAGQLQRALGPNPQFPGFTIDPVLKASVDDWAKQIVDDADTHIIAISELLGSDGGKGLIQSCGQAFAARAQATGPLPFDDRIYYQPLMHMVAYYAMWMTRGLQMLREAYHWRAMDQYAIRLNTDIRTTCGGTLNASCNAWKPPSTPEELCSIANSLEAGSTSPMVAAQPDCGQLENLTNSTQLRVVRAIELVGAPFSVGDAKGQGVRLVLGTNQTVDSGRRTVLEEKLKENGQHFIDTATVALVPASPGEFDPACAYANATAPACSLLAPWDKVNSTATWSGLYYPAGYAADLWKPAGVEVWFTLRWGMNVSTAYNGGDLGSDAKYASNLLFTLESTDESSNQVPFWGLTDRLWAIDGTADIALPDLLSGKNVPTDGYQQGTSYWINNKVRVRGVRMLAHAGADDRRSGPAGVAMYSADFKGVIPGECYTIKWVPSTNNPTGDQYHPGQYCLSQSCHEEHGAMVSPLRFSCAGYIDFALECIIDPSDWVQQLFPAIYDESAFITVQCPAYPYMWSTDVGFSSGKPYYPRCGLSTKSSGTNFDGTSGTESTCCFEQTRDSQNTCEDLPYDNTNKYMQPSCNRYSYKDNDYCQDMNRCLGDGRMSLPFLAGSWLDTGTAEPCFKSPPNSADYVHRLPTIDIRTIPQVLSPFTGKRYCKQDEYGVPVSVTHGLPTRCGADMTRFVADVLGSSLGAYVPYDATSWPPGDIVNNTATRVEIALAADGDTVTCTPKFVRADGTSPSSPVVQVVSKLVFVGSGPMNYADARASYPANGTDLYAAAGPNNPPLTSLSLRQTLPANAAANISALPRTVDCTIRARDPGNGGIPIIAAGSAAIVDDGNGSPRVLPDWLFPLAVCGGVYVANATDANNCGTCGTVCPPGSTCVLGNCVCSLTITSTQTLTATAARNVSVSLVGGGGGAAGTLPADDVAAGGSTGGGGGGGSSAVLVGGTPSLVAPGGAGGAPTGKGSNYTSAAANGLPGVITSGKVTVAAGDVVTVFIGGGGGGGGALSSTALAQQQSQQRRFAAGGAGGAGWFGGGGGWAGPTQYDATVHGRATGGGAAAGGSGYAAGTALSGGNGNIGPVRSATTLGVYYARGGRRDTRGTGASWDAAGTAAPAGGAGGGGACGGGGGAGSSGVAAVNVYGLDGGAVASNGGGGAAGASTWASGIKAGVGAGGRAGVMDGLFPGPTSEGGAAGLAVLRWESTGGTCAF